MLGEVLTHTFRAMTGKYRDVREVAMWGRFIIILLLLKYMAAIYVAANAQPRWFSMISHFTGAEALSWGISGLVAMIIDFFSMYVSAYVVTFYFVKFKKWKMPPMQHGIIAFIFLVLAAFITQIDLNMAAEGAAVKVYNQTQQNYAMPEDKRSAFQQQYEAETAIDREFIAQFERTHSYKGRLVLEPAWKESKEEYAAEYEHYKAAKAALTAARERRDAAIARNSEVIGQAETKRDDLNELTTTRVTSGIQHFYILFYIVNFLLMFGVSSCEDHSPIGEKGFFGELTESLKGGGGSKNNRSSGHGTGSGNPFSNMNNGQPPRF